LRSHGKRCISEATVRPDLSGLDGSGVLPFFQECSMANDAADTGFRYTKVMAWGPPIILALALILLVAEQMLFGGLLAVAGIVFWVIVRRRKQQATP
jgi:hypothetical protein